MFDPMMFHVLSIISTFLLSMFELLYPTTILLILIPIHQMS